MNEHSAWVAGTHRSWRYRTLCLQPWRAAPLQAWWRQSSSSTIPQLNTVPVSFTRKRPYFSYFLNVSNGLEPQLDFTESGHVAGILGSSTVTVGLLRGETGDGLPGKHGEEMSEQTGTTLGEHRPPLSGVLISLPKFVRRLKYRHRPHPMTSDSILTTSSEQRPH